MQSGIYNYEPLWGEWKIDELIGKGRVYLFRNNKLKQISVDDTTAQRLINMGVLTKEKAKTHEDRHKLTQHLGIYKDEMIVEPHISSEIVIKKGDCFLLCSDGLTDMVEDERISEIIKNLRIVRWLHAN